MITLELAYILASGISVLAMAPQVKKLITARSSDELSLVSWLVWMGAQVITLAYSISLKVVPFIIIGSFWVLYYVTIVCMIIWYRYKSRINTLSTSQDINLVDDTTLVGITK